jgi:choline dehydrogenase-like flavoprotein
MTSLASSEYDAIIIGSGAGGGPLAFRLSAAGMRVVVLEKGKRYARTDYVHDELIDVVRPGMFVPTTTDDPHVLVDHSSDDPSPRLSSIGWIASCIGGGTTHMGGSFYRFHPSDFRLRSLWGEYFGIADWPYSYDDLEPYYAAAEYAVGVCGVSESSRFLGYRSNSYPMPPLSRHPLAAALVEACRRMELNPLTTPRAINSVPYDGRPACSDCSFCAGFGCPTGARGTVQETVLARAEATGRCEVREQAMVREIVIGRDGLAAGCVYIDAQNHEQRVRGRVVCVCCSAVESARLLLLSRSPQFPDGAANDGGLVGRHLQFHVGTTGRGRFPIDRQVGPSPSEMRHGLGVSIHDFLDWDDSPSGWPRGGILRFDMKRVHPIMSARRVARSRTGDLLWGERLRTALRTHLAESCEVEFEAFQEFIPNEETFVELDPQIRDKWGLPVARIYVSEPSHHRLAGEHLREKGLQILTAMGAIELTPGDAGYLNGVMVHGTCRAGGHASQTVLNAFCQSHAVANLFVVDGSFMPTSGAAASTLTIMANSLRTADYILDLASCREL